MSNSEPSTERGIKMGATRRKAVRLSPEGLVREQALLPDRALPWLITPAQAGIDLAEWSAAHRQVIEHHLLTIGAVLFRDFGVRSEAELERFVQGLSGDLLEYTYRSTPRKQVAGNIYTSTEYPADQHIPLHNELSYTREWPMKIAFCCLKSAQQGGETPIADSRRIYQAIDPALRERFASRQVMYVRTYGGGLDLSWEEVFQTSDRGAVEEFCRSRGIEFEWKNDNRLRTRQICQAVACHPATGEPVWFNQAHLFHVSGLPAALRESLLAAHQEEDLPRNVYYGDGSPIEPESLAEIRRVLQQEAVSFPWQEGDVLLLDNMLTAHARTPFVGPRRIVVGMAQPYSSSEPAASV
jgi:alpha-ketoglutarate-dependent taurine dioxygenase